MTNRQNTIQLNVGYFDINNKLFLEYGNIYLNRAKFRCFEILNICLNNKWQHRVPSQKYSKRFTICLTWHRFDVNCIQWIRHIHHKNDKQQTTQTILIRTCVCCLLYSKSKSELLIPVLLNDNKISCTIVDLASSVMSLCLYQTRCYRIQYPQPIISWLST